MKEVDTSEWLALHKQLGCEGCKYCDESKLNIDSCCTKSGTLEIDKEGACLTKRWFANGA